MQKRPLMAALGPIVTVPIRPAAVGRHLGNSSRKPNEAAVQVAATRRLNFLRSMMRNTALRIYQPPSG
jgi:hypothetical protein